MLQQVVKDDDPDELEDSLGVVVGHSLGLGRGQHHAGVFEHLEREVDVCNALGGHVAGNRHVLGWYLDGKKECWRASRGGSRCLGRL